MNWQTKKLGDVCNIINGSTPLRSNKAFWEHGDVSWFTVDDIREQGRIIQYTKQKITKAALSKTSAKLLPPESVLLCCTASVGEYALAKIPLTTNQQFNGLVVKDRRILDPLFLFYFSSTLKDKLLGLSGKTTIDFIPISRLKEVEILLPPISEQKLIVKKLNEVFEEITNAKEAAEKNLQNSRELFDSYLHNVFANPSKDWKEKELGSVCEIINGGTPDTKIPEYWNGENLWITPKDMGKLDDIFVDNTIRRLSTLGLKNSSAKLLPENSVILSSRAPIGHLAINKKQMATNQGCKGLIPNDELETLFLFYFLKNSVQLLNELGSGTTFKELSGTKLAKVVISMPPKAEQIRIAKNLTTLSAEVEKLEQAYKKKLEDLKELKKSVLKTAFSDGFVTAESVVPAVPMSVPSPYVRNQVHAAILDQVVRDSGSTTEVAVAKYDHLLQELCGLPLGYQFATHQFGPFDNQIKRLVSSGLGKNKWFTKRSGMIVFGSNVNALLSRQSNLYRSAQASMRELSRLGITKLDSDGVELLSTVCHSIKETGSVTIDAIRAFMSNWQTDNNARTKAEKFSEERTQKCLDFILKNNLHQKLLPTT